MRPLFNSSTMRIAMTDTDSGAKSFLLDAIVSALGGTETRPRRFNHDEKRLARSRHPILERESPFGESGAHNNDWEYRADRVKRQYQIIYTHDAVRS
jgi:hypothetical protein